jgi:CelD/BcsL family acetyltransferase involved in cellulose biosynthesis
MWKIDWITDWTTIDSEEFRRFWLKTFHSNQSNHVFFHPVIVKAWIDSFRSFEDISPLFCVARIENIDLILPLVSWKRNVKNLRQRIILPIGFSEFDYHDPVISDNISSECIGKFWDQFVNEIGERFYFNKLVLNGIRITGTAAGFGREHDICPLADLSKFNSFEDFIAGMKGSLRGDIYRQERKLKALGDIKLVTYDQGHMKEALEELEIFLVHHKSKWPHAFKPPGFYQNLVIYGIPAGVTNFSVLYLNEYPVNWHLGFNAHGRFYYYMHTFDQGYSNFSPGKVHLFYLIKNCFRERIQTFDFLRGEEAYKADVSRKSSELFQLTMVNQKLYSKIKNYALSLLRGIK